MESPNSMLMGQNSRLNEAWKLFSPKKKQKKWSPKINSPPKKKGYLIAIKFIGLFKGYLGQNSRVPAS